MPMKLNVGLSRKVGLPDYSSVGASCNLELELESALLKKDVEAFHEQVRDAYAAVHKAVHDELARQQAPVAIRTEEPAWVSSPEPDRNGCGRAPRGGNSTRFQEARSRGRQNATPKQVKAILAIARRQEVGLEGLLRQEFDAERPEELTLKQASRLIDLLKNGENNRTQKART